MAEKTKVSRRQRERQRHKMEILNTAMRLFSEKGFHNVSMNEIAAEAEFATGTLYNFFSSKEALYEEIMAQCAERVLGKALPTLDSDDDERNRIASFIQAGVETFRENAAVIRLSLQATGGPAVGTNDPQKKEIHSRLVGKLAEVLTSGIRRGVFRDIDSTVVAMALLAAIESLIFLAARDGQEGLLEQRMAHLEELFFKGILYA